MNNHDHGGGPPRSDPAMSATDREALLTSLRCELDYYRRQVDELAGENLRQTYVGSELVWQLTRKRQGFTALATLQQAFTIDVPFETVLRKVLQVLVQMLGMDRAVVLGPPDASGQSAVLQWLGFTVAESSDFSGLTLRWSAGEGAPPGELLVNSTTTPDRLARVISSNFGIPYFIGLPVTLGPQSLCMLIAGRLAESRPFRPQLDRGDLDTLTAIGHVITTWAQNRRVVELREEIVRRELERHAIMEEERARISRDMHDEVGSSLTRIAMLSELARGAAGDPRMIAQHLSAISADARSVIDAIGEIVWSINPGNDTLENLAAYVREYVSGYFEHTSVACAIDFPEIVPCHPLSAELRRNVFLVIKEGVNNIAKYAAASSVHLQMQIDRNVLRFTLRDHGSGFDVGTVRRFAGGLRNMRRRMEEIGGCCLIESQPGSGTCVTAIVEIPSYAHTEAGRPATCTEFQVSG